MVVQGLLDHCSTNARTSVSMKTGLLGKAPMRSTSLEFQVLKPRELFGTSVSCACVIDCVKCLLLYFYYLHYKCMYIHMHKYKKL